jgi:RNA-directed DNA polymerase
MDRKEYLVMTQDPRVDTGGSDNEAWLAGLSLVARRQYKLHKLAVADPGHRFDDLFNLVAHPQFLAQAWTRVVTNRGSRSAGVDGWTTHRIQTEIGVPGFLDDLRTELKQGRYRPLPVRQRLIPKPGSKTKKRRLGIPTVKDRVVQGALKLVLEPIFEAGFEPVSYGFRPNRRAHDAIAEVHHYATQGYRWVLEGDIEACFDRIDHTALMDKVRARIKDKRVCALVKAFLKAGILTELGQAEDPDTGTPQGGILSPVLANIALTGLDEAFTADWQEHQPMSTQARRARRRRKGLGNWRIVRYADDFVVLCDTNPEQCEQARQLATQALEPMGLTLSPHKTLTTHLSGGIDFLGFHIRWQRKQGTNKWHVYTFPAQRAIRQVKQKLRALTHRSSTADLETILTRINQILKGWAMYFRHGVSYHVFDHLHQYTWHRIVTWQRTLHRWNWQQLRHWLTTPQGHWKPIQARNTILYNPTSIGIIRYRYRGYTIPNPFQAPLKTKPA